MEFKPGDRVMIRKWQDMKEEYGVNEGNSIAPRLSSLTVFAEMRGYCGGETKVESVIGGNHIKLEIDDGKFIWPDWALILTERKLEQTEEQILMNAVKRYVLADKSPNVNAVLAILGIEKQINREVVENKKNR